MGDKGKLLIIGFGPGAFEHITERARAAIEESEVVIGYNTYVDLIRGLLTDQEIVRTGMTEEVSRAQEAVRQAERGRKVAVISSGDAGVYGMAGLVYEVLIGQEWNPSTGVEVEVIPGVSAINSCASLLGAPVMHDACTISLSDHLTPWEMIARRVEAAASADFVIALYNPRSGRRTRQIVETQRILLKYRAPDTPVGLVKSAYRDREQVIVTTLGKMLEHDIGMLTTVIIGNSATFVYHGKIITPRGYQRKYTLDSLEQPLKPHERLRPEAEPWSLHASEGTEDWESEEEELAEAETAAGRPRGAVPAEPSADKVRNHPAALAMQALSALKAAGVVSDGGVAEADRGIGVRKTKPVAIFEAGVSPGIANKKFSARQMAVLAEMAGETGELEYTPNHQIIMRVQTEDPSELVNRLKQEKLLVFPIGDVAQIKACDFCNLEKDSAIPVAERLNVLVGGMKAPKELMIGVNGCGMACYGAVLEDIGIVHRSGAYDLFLGGKKIGRNAHPAQLVAEGISAEDIVPAVERIYKQYAEQGHPNERFHKFFKRVGVVGGFQHREHAPQVEVNAVCGD
ncbi:precorrin-3B C(17)-methyltransferase [Paenibacillus allorhizosphaerae]|uniref:Cobalt-factor III methyltransferase n=1 Tax=Paenibacillus allorhizosphaerae TaxID=2849866 RepID=A0ABM8VF96_9BACL|nr:precorrin-3B C(17)-methyltransferase [Paenibacillus allorhizosphaerae]CAG7634045.1 Cobalt-factor III methyltransferase [Paenibacillus allorhizosphaerae]